MALRLPFWHLPLTADEGGYGEIARLWSRGAVLYRDAWVDRPQGLLLVFRAILHVDGGSVEAMRGAAAAVAGVVAVVIMAITLRLGGRIAAAAAALLAASVGASPYIEAFTLAGEALAALPAVLSLLAFLVYLRRGRAGWLLAAGLLTGCAFMVKQSALDAGLAAVLYLLWTRRLRGLGPVLALVGAAALPVLAGMLASGDVHAWWDAVVAYRGQGDSLLTGSPGQRLHDFRQTGATVALALSPLLVLAAYALPRAPLLARLWLLTAALGVAGGGNFHAHYYIQLVPPLAVLAGLGAERALERRAAVPALLGLAALAVSLLATGQLLTRSSDERTLAVFPADPHLLHDGAVARYVRAHSRPGQRVLVVWAAANVYYLADRPPAIPYLWYRNIQTLPAALPAARAALSGPRPPVLVVVENDPGGIDAAGRTAALLRRRYRPAARVEGVPILRLRAASSTSRAASSTRAGRSPTSIHSSGV